MTSNKLAYIPNGIDVAKYASGSSNTDGIVHREKDDFVWISIGRLEAPKNYDLLLNAFAGIRASTGCGRLLIVGSGTMEPHLRSLAEQREIADHCQFLGHREDIPALLKSADGFVLSSAWEGMPNSLLEAMAAGVPSIATKVGAVSFLLGNSDRGLVVPPGSKRDLMLAMNTMMCMSRDERLKMSQSAQQFVKTRFSWDIVVDKWESTLRDLLC